MPFAPRGGGKRIQVQRNLAVGVLKLSHEFQRLERERRDLAAKRRTARTKNTAVAETEVPAPRAPAPAGRAAAALLQHRLIAGEFQELELEIGDRELRGFVRVDKAESVAQMDEKRAVLVALARKHVRQ